MLIMDPDGSIEPLTASAATGDAVATVLERVLLVSDTLGYDITSEVHAMVDAKLVLLADRLALVTRATQRSMVAA